MSTTTDRVTTTRHPRADRTPELVVAIDTDRLAALLVTRRASESTR
jgi:hypothetical protein